MPSTPRTDGPRHMAGRPRRPAARPFEAMAPVADGAVDLEVAEVPAAAAVPRSRLFFAVAITLAALPVLVLDNLPATADANPVVATRSAVADEAATRALVPTTSAAPATTVVTTAPTVTTPPTTAPPVTEAPPTTAPAVRTVAVPAPVPTTAPPTTEAPAARSASRTDPNDPATWDRLAACEAGGVWSANTGNGYYGGLQFSKGTWDNLGGSAFAEYPHQATKAQQIEIGQRQYARSGWDAWPGCRDQLGFS